MNNLGILTKAQGDPVAARNYYEESLVIFQEFGNRSGMADTLNNLGNVASSQGDYASARNYHEQSLELHRELDDQKGIGSALNNLGNVVAALGDFASARTCYAESLAIRHQIGDLRGLAGSLESLAILTAQTGTIPPAVGTDEGENAVSALRRAARLWGAAQALREAIGAPLGPVDQADQDQEMMSARQKMSEADWETAWEEGRKMTLEQAVEEALQG